MRWTESVVKEVLPTGLTLLVQRAAAAPVVAVVTHVRAGYFDEPDPWNGIAHVLEHMYFKGTARLGPGALARETQRLGGYLNAGTIYDKTVYYAVTPAAGDGLERTVELQADALMHLTLDQGELSRELEVIIQEAKRKLDNPPAVTGETLYELLYDVHRIRRWRIGTEAGLRALTAGDLRSYYRTRYAPERTIVAMVGALDPEQALAIGRRVYGGWTRTSAPIAGSPVERVPAPPRMRILDGDVQRPLAVVGWRGVPPLHPDATALDVAADVLGGGRASWLTRAVRLPGLAEAAGASNFSAGDVGVFDVNLTAGLGTLDAALGRSLELVAVLGERGPAAEDLERVKSLAATGWARRFESCDGRATALCEFEALGDVTLADRWYDRLLAMTVDEVRDVAARYLVPDAASAVLYLPRDASAGAFATWPRTVVARPPRTPGTRTLERGGAVTPSGGRHVIGGVTHLATSGADLLAHTKRGTGLVSLGVYFNGVLSQETPETAGLSRLYARAALRGAGGLGAEELAAAAEMLGGSIGVAVDADTLGWTITVRADALGDAAELLRMLVGDPMLRDEDVTTERDLQVGDARRARDDMFRHPLEAVLRAAFGADPYGLPTLGEPDQLATLMPDTVRKWAERVRRHRALVVAAGDAEPGALLDALGTFVEWPGRAPEDRTEAPAWRPGRAVELREKAQSALAMAFPAPRAAAPERFALAVAGAVLSGLAGRLFDELRERRALAYTVQAVPLLRARAGAMLAYIATSPEREAEAREAMLAELDRLGRDPIPHDELDRASRYAAGLVAIRRQHTAAIAGEIARAWTCGTLEVWAEKEARLRAVTAEEVAEVAASVFRAEERAEFVVRGSGGGR